MMMGENLSNSGEIEEINGLLKYYIEGGGDGVGVEATDFADNFLSFSSHPLDHTHCLILVIQH